MTTTNTSGQAASQSLGAPAASDDAANEVIVDRRDLFDFIRAAWREGSSVGSVDTAESWHKATDYAEGVIKGWSTLRPAAPQPSAEPAPATRSFWVAERFADGRSAGYWDGGHSQSFTLDIEKAVQFCRRMDAFWPTRGMFGSDTKLTEHIMLAAQPAPAPLNGQQVGEVCESSGEHDARVVLNRDLPIGTKLYAAPLNSVSEQDERARFEAWAGPNSFYLLEMPETNKRGPASIYYNARTQHAWEGWQARAAMTATPSKQEQGE